MIYDAVYSSASMQNCDPRMVMMIKRQVMQMVTTQTMKTMEFAGLYRHLQASGISPCVVKGIICRNMYPNPDYRISSDEDVFIPEEQFHEAHKVMQSYGMILSMPDQNIDLRENGITPV